MDYGAVRDDEGRIRGGVITETDGEIFNERKRVGELNTKTLAEIAGMKSMTMDKLEAQLDKLRSRREAVHGEIISGIRKELRTLADGEGISIDDDGPLRPMTNDELSRIESVNLLIEQTMKKLQGASRDFYTEQIALHEKAEPKIMADIAKAETKLREHQDELHRTKISSKKFKQQLELIQNYPASYSSPMRARMSPAETLTALMRYEG